MEDLIIAAQSGDQNAFERLMDRFQDRVFAVALAQLGNYHRAQDATQEAFVEAYLRLGQLQSPAAFPSWLHKIVLGKCVRTLRSGKSVVAPLSWEILSETPSLAPDPEAVLLERSARETLQRAIDQLSDQEREAFLLFAVGGYSYSEITQLMELPLSLVKKRIYMARQRLRNGDELSELRPSLRAGLPQRVMKRTIQRERALEKMKMAKNGADEYTVDLIGPGIESKTAVKNLYVYYRYELLTHSLNQYDGLMTPPSDVSDETWRAGAWVNQAGVINGLHSLTHEQTVLGEDGFWEAPNLQAFLIRLNGWPAGFACVASPPNATKGVDYRLQEFFVINKARRLGVGSEAARQLFDRLPGRWELAYDPTNPASTAFWRTVVPEYTGGDFMEEMIGMGTSMDLPGYVFTKGPRPSHPIKVR
jgi:RNA polymerase sigma factor (sigma-70 family)